MNGVPSPLLSVIIPTKRSRLDETVRAAVRSVLDLAMDDLECLLHVDRDTDELTDFMPAKEVVDARFRYVEHPAAVPMTENWNLAVGHARGKYLFICGDDDCVMPSMVDVVRWAEGNNVDCVVHTGRWLYYWPSYPDGKRAGRLSWLPFEGNAREVDTSLAAVKNASGVRMKFYRDMPEIYHGLVLRDIVEAMKKRAGSYFLSIIPDLYFAFAAVPFVKRMVVLDFPFSMSGHSRKANAARFVQNRMKEQEEQYRTFQWEPEVPPSPYFVSFYADSKLKAYRATGQDQLVRHYSEAMHYAHCLLNKPRDTATKRLLVKNLIERKKGRPLSIAKSCLSIMFYCAGELLFRILERLPRPLRLARYPYLSIFKGSGVNAFFAPNIEVAAKYLTMSMQWRIPDLG